MPDESTRLFATRSERYPEPSDADIAQGTARAALSAIPVLGGTITEVLSMVLAPAVARRRDQWFKELADGLEDLEKKFDGFRVQDLEHDEAFVSAVIEASRAAISTHQAEKREALRNAILNIALKRSPGEDQEAIFIKYIDDLTVWHIRILSLFQNPSKKLAEKGIILNYMSAGASVVLESYYPEIAGRRELYDQIVADLNARGLSNSPNFLHTMMTQQGLTTKRTTPLADKFLAFISDPLC